jgi:hypothetical protein
VGRSENVFGLQLFHQLSQHSALELGRGYAMPRVKVSNSVIMVGEKSATVHVFNSVRFHIFLSRRLRSNLE